MSATNYNVGVTIQLVDRVTGAMGAVTRSLSAAGAASSVVQGRLGKLQNTLMAIQRVGAVGHEIFHAAMGFFGAIEPAGKEYVKQVNRMNMLGYEQVEIQKSIKTAWQTTADVITTTATDNIRTIAELNAVLLQVENKKLSMAHSREILPFVQQSKAIFSASGEKYGVKESGSELSYAAVKTSEQLGKFKPEDILHNLDWMEKVMVATQGKVTPVDFLQATKYARQARLTLSEDFWKNIMPELILENKTSGHGGVGASGPGVGMAGLFSWGVMGKMTATAAKNLAGYGVFEGQMPSKRDPHPHGGIKDHELFAKNPLEWLKKDLVPAIQKKHPAMKGLQLLIEIARVMDASRVTTSTMMELQNKDSLGLFKRFRESTEHIPSHKDLYKLALQSPDVAEQAFTNQMENVKTALGKVLIPALLPFLMELSSALNKLAVFLGAHPEMVENILALGAGIAAFGAVLTTGAALAGVALLATALSPAGALVVGITALIALLGGAGLTKALLDAKNGSVQAQTRISALSVAMENLKDVAANVVTPIKNLATWLGSITSGFGKFLDNRTGHYEGLKLPSFDPDDPKNVGVFDPIIKHLAHGYRKATDDQRQALGWGKRGNIQVPPPPPTTMPSMVPGSSPTAKPGLKTSSSDVHIHGPIHIHGVQDTKTMMRELASLVNRAQVAAPFPNSNLMPNALT